VNVVVMESKDRWIEEIAQLFRARALRAIRQRGRFTCALTGGSAVGDLYRRIASEPIDWERVDLYWGDERAVPPDHAESNYRLAKETLLDPAQVPATSVHRMRGECDDLEHAAAEYERELKVHLGKRESLDLVLLGMGPDGHVCSLFPEHALLAEEKRLVATVRDSPKPPQERLTLTMPALSRAKEIWFLVLGSSKAEAVREALEDPRSRLPAAIVQRTKGSVLWILDRAAASLLAA
jgi:6-phosphogluconolactonase